MTQPAFAVESAMHELALALDIDPLELRRRNIIRPGDALLAIDDHPDDVAFTEDGLGAVHRPRRRGAAAQRQRAGTRRRLARRHRHREFASTRPHRRPSTSPRRGRRCVTTASYEIAVGTVEFGEGTSTAHVQIAASMLGTTPSRIHLVQSDTDRTGFDTGAFASAGLFVAGNAVQRASTALRDRILRVRRRARPGRRRRRARWMTTESSAASTRLSLAELLEAARARGIRFTEARKAYGSPRSVTSNTHGFRIAVHRVTGEIRILYSVQATDAGVVINPAQVRGQVEGGVAQAIGFALTENFHVDANGVMVNPNLRNYRIPTYADIPRTEVLLVDSNDSVGPMRSKGMAECCINPVAPALANALAGCDRRALPSAAAHPRAHLQPTRPEPLARDDVSRETRAMDTKKPTDTAATVIIGQRVRAGSELEFEAWQEDMNREASKYPGFLGAEINPPTAVQPEWVVVYRFDSIAHVQAWINSAHAAGSTGRGSAVLRRARHPAGSRWRRAAHGSPRHRRRHPPREPGERRGLPRLAGPAARWRRASSRASAAPSCSARSRVFRRNGPRSTATRTRPTSTSGLSPKERQDLLAEGAKFSDFQLQHHRQLVRQLVRLRRARQPGAAALGNQDVHRGVGGPLPDRRCCSASRCLRCRCRCGSACSSETCCPASS